jgi:hypothetical protein
MGRKNFERKEGIFFSFFSNPLTKRILKSIQLPAFYLVISLIIVKSLPTLEEKISQLSSSITLENPSHECSFVNIEAAEEKTLIEEAITKQTSHFPLLNGTEKITKKLLKKIPYLASVTCSLDKNNKLHFKIIGKDSKLLLAENKSHEAVKKNNSTEARAEQMPQIAFNKKRESELYSIFDAMDQLLSSTSTFNLSPEDIFKDNNTKKLSERSNEKSIFTLEPTIAIEEIRPPSCKRNTV